VTYALFLGCSVPVRALNYELSARKVASRLGIPLADVEDFACCGYPLAAVSEPAAFAMAARNLALAAGRGHDIVALCSACSGFLMESASRLREDPALRDRVNAILDPQGLSFDARKPVAVRSLVNVLLESGGEEKVRAAVAVPLKNIRVAVHYGCHVLRPRSLHGEEDPENPVSIDRLVALAGGESVAYENRLACCGGGILGIKEDTALRVARRKLDAVAEAKADAMVLVCPFCSVMFEGNQKKIEKISGTGYGLPVLYLTQLLGLAMGMSADDLGFPMNRIKAQGLLDRIASV
jgi:heterodisulfide reductase subunit B